MIFFIMKYIYQIEWMVKYTEAKYMRLHCDVRYKFQCLVQELVFVSKLKYKPDMFTWD